MPPTPFFKQPLFWLAGVGAALLLVLAFWYIKRPEDDTGRSLILTHRAQRAVEQDLTRNAALRHQDSVQVTREQTAAATLYQQGQQQALRADQLRQQTHEKRSSTPDSGTQQLQRALSDY